MTDQQVQTGDGVDAIPSPPPHTGEWFRFLAATWDVEMAQGFVEGITPTRTVDVQEIIRSQGGFVGYDQGRVENDDGIDIRIGIILCPVFLQDPPKTGRGSRKKKAPLQEQPDAYLVIDGWHRIRKAERLGVERLPAHILTFDQGRKVRIS